MAREKKFVSGESGDPRGGRGKHMGGYVYGMEQGGGLTPYTGKHRQASGPPASRTAEFHNGIHGAGFSQYPKLGNESLDQAYKSARGM